MQTFLNRQRWVSCPYDPLTLDQLSDEELSTKRIKNRQMGGVVLVLIGFMLGMTLLLDNYLVAVTTWALIPAISEYMKRRKALLQQIRKRNLI